jgi:phosphopantothenoylcysteine decarboxylase/phosphopantothenate--cysteine ligase
MERVDLAFVVGNDASVMGDERTRAILVTGDGETVVEGSKADLGARVAEQLAAVLSN